MSDGRWTVDGSRLVLEDRWIRVRADDCITPQGASVAPYYVLEYPDWVLMVAVNAQNELLMVRQYRHAYGDFTLELPAGGMEPSDRGPLEAAARELLEETGCAAGSLELIGQFSLNPATHANAIHAVLARDVTVAGRPLDDPAEQIEALWVPLDKAVELAASGAMPTLAQTGALFLALRRLGVLTLAAPA